MRQDSAQTHGTATAATASTDQHKPGLKARALDEGKKMLIMTAYLWVLFAVLNLHKSAILAQDHINYEEQGFAIVNALVFAKVMLVADSFNLGSRFEKKSLIYSVLYASLMFSIVLVGFHIVESGVAALFHGKPFSEGLADFGAGNLRGVLSYGAIAFVALIPFFLFRGIARVVGEDALWGLVFKRDTRRFTLVMQD